MYVFSAESGAHGEASLGLQRLRGGMGSAPMRKGKASNRMDKLFSKGTNMTQQAVRAGMIKDFDEVAPGKGATKLDRMNEKALIELRRRSSITRRELREKGAIQGNNMESAQQTLGIQRKVLEGSSETRALTMEGRKELKRQRKENQQREKTLALAGSIEVSARTFPN
jgi:hypothetical protein